MGKIQEAIRSANPDAIREVIAQHPESVNQPDDRGFPPLVLASYSQQTAICKILLENGAEVDGRDMAGNTALMGVAFKGLMDIARLLIEHGADVNAQNKTGARPLFLRLHLVKPKSLAYY